MCKKSPLRRPFDKWHVKRVKTLVKPERQQLYNTYWPLWKQFTWKKPLLVIIKILGLFVNPLTADDKYSFVNRGYLLQLFQMHLSQKRKRNSNFFFFFLDFLNLDLLFKFLKKKMAVVADVFLNWYFSKNVVRLMPKKSCFRGLSTSNKVNGPEHCSNMTDIAFTIFINPFKINACWKSRSEWHAKY